MSIEVASFGRALLFLGVGFLLLTFVLQWMWARTCDRNIRVLIVMQTGGTRWVLAPREGGAVTITDPVDKTMRAWPMSELATAEVQYPGVGFVPGFLQKTIRMAILLEGDWEPLLNRSPHREKVASPDVASFLRDLADTEQDGDRKAAIERLLSGISTGPTREMIADPAVLGNLQRSTVMRSLATIGDDLAEALRDITGQLSRLKGMSPLIVYAGLGLAVVLLCVLLVRALPVLEQIADVGDKLDAIQRALGLGSETLSK